MPSPRLAPRALSALARASYAALCGALVGIAACSSALSPYAADEDAEPDAAARPQPTPARPTSVGATPASAAAPAPTSAPARPVASPAAGADPAPNRDALFTLDQALPECAIHNLTADCPDASTVLRFNGQGLPCRRDQIGARCAYPSPMRGANLLECVPQGSAGIWEFHRERCSRACFGEIPHSFAELSSRDCLDRTPIPCDGAGTDQTAVDQALKEVARGCGGGSPSAYGLLLDENGCGRGLFIEDNGRLAKCMSDAVMKMRFACSIRCVSTFEDGDHILE